MSDSRSRFEAWWRKHWDDATEEMEWQEDRCCYADFRVHIAFKAYQAGLAEGRAKAATDGDEQGRDVTALLGHTNAKQTETYLRKTKVPLVQGPTMKGAK